LLQAELGRIEERRFELASGLQPPLRFTPG
jgi:hypothetical protein